MRFGRIMLAVGLVATLGLVATGVQGYAAVDAATEGASLRNHVLGGLVALLLFVLAHGWVLIYLVGIGGLLRREARAAGREAALDAPLRSPWRGAVPPALAAVAGIAVFVLGSGVYSGRVTGEVHGAALWGTVVLQVWAVAAEWRALAVSERALSTLRR